MRTVFLSYRRGDSEGLARALSLELVTLIGRESVFMDVDSIALGRDFRHILHERLESCDLFLALIGPGWLDAKDSAGNRRLDNATDLVRQEIAAALKRNIPVTPVLLQGAEMPPAERLPEDIRELVYRNGFELGHSTWESDVREMVRRLSLSKDFAAPAAATNAIRVNTARWAPTSFKTVRLVSTLAMIGAIAVGSFYWTASRQNSGSGISPPLQQPGGASPQSPAGFSSGQFAGAAGLGVISIANLKLRTAEVFEQSSSAESKYAAGYVGTISPSEPTLQVPAGTYKLKFDNLFVERVAITTAGSAEIVLGTISLPNLARTVQVFEQSSSGKSKYVAGYAGTISPMERTLQVPAGTYKLKFDNLFAQPIRVESGKTAVAK
jgi:hypothetical protein